MWALTLLVLGTWGRGTMAFVVPDATTQRALICEECTGGEYDSVVALGNGAIPQLLRAMAGPGTRRERTVLSTASTTHVRVALLDGSLHVGDSLTVAAAAVRRFRASWQSRAMFLLRKIGTPQAKWALHAGLMAIPINRKFRIEPTARAYGDSLYRTFP